MSDNNIKLWSKFEKTDPAHVKAPTKGTSGLSSIDAYYVFQQATKAFGPCGIGWGYEEVSENYQTGEPIINDAGEIVGSVINHIVRIKLWYMLDGVKGELPSIGSTKYLQSTKYGMRSDEEAPKKSLTDAIKKALSMLGFCSDVYMGKFEDMTYVNEVANEKAIEKAVDKDSEKAKQAAQLNADVDKCLEQMRQSVSVSMLEGLYKATARKVNGKDDSLMRKLVKTKDEVLAKLKEKDNENA